MTDFTLHTPENAPGKSKVLLENIKKRAGFVPSLYAVMAESPELVEAYLKLHELFLHTSFNNDEKTVVWQAINVEHNCHYCVPAHTAIAHSMKVSDDIINALRDETPLQDSRLEVLRSFTLAVIRKRGEVTENDVETFLAAGFTRKNILEVILCAAQKTISNYTNHISDTPLDAPFSKYEWKKK